MGVGIWDILMHVHVQFDFLRTFSRYQYFFWQAATNAFGLFSESDMDIFPIPQINA